MAAYGADALPLVLAGLKDSDNEVRLQAVQTLQTMPGDLSNSLPLLLPLLKSNEAKLRQAAVYALNRVGEKGLPHLLDALKDGDRNVRLAALNGLRQQGTGAAKAVPVLVELLKKDADLLVRRNAMSTLISVGRWSDGPVDRRQGASRQLLAAHGAHQFELPQRHEIGRGSQGRSALPARLAQGRLPPQSSVGLYDPGKLRPGSEGSGAGLDRTGGQ